MSTNTLFANLWVKRLSFVLIILAVGLVVSFIIISAQPDIHLDVFEPQAEQATIAGRNLTTLSSDEVSAYRWQAMADFYEKNGLLRSDALDYEQAANNMAARWIAMAEYYKAHGMLTRAESLVPVTGFTADKLLTDYDAGEASAYRWRAMAQYYAQAPTNSVDLTTLSAEEVLAYRWQAMAQYYASHPDAR